MQLTKIYDIIEEDLQTVQDRFNDIVESQEGITPELSTLLAAALGGGKVVRPALAFLCARCFDYKNNQSKVRSFAAASELLHISTLVHDDAIDKADTRRGKPTINSYFGTEKAVLLGDFMFASAAELVADTDSMDIVRIFSQTLQTITSGEIKQSFDLYQYNQDITDYNKRIFGKTASLIMMSAKGGAMLAGATPKQIVAIQQYAEKTGMAFQIVDDILDFTGDEEKMGKPVGGDLIGGTITLPALYYLQEKSDNLIWDGFNEKNEAKRTEILTQAVKEIASSGDYIERAYREAERYKNEAVAALDAIPESEAKGHLIWLSDYLIQRNV